MISDCPRIMLTAPASGSGKTLITCGILQALVNRRLDVASFKCGPDYIDPMFHSRIIGARSRNLDTFFTDAPTTRYLFGRAASTAEISVIEGVMGFYDGMGADLSSSSYDLSNTLDVPVVLILNCKGAATSVVALIKGMKEFRENRIVAVILNRMSMKVYPEVKALIEKEVGIRVLGTLPDVKDMILESRHLGLVLPGEVQSLREKMNSLAAVVEKNIDMDALIELAHSAPPVSYDVPDMPEITGHPRIGLASDDAFCFTYADNIDLLREMGAEIVEFSPINDERLPKGLDGIILSGGYPELHAKALSSNVKMMSDIREAIENGMPCIAECGGFMYLNRSLQDQDGKPHPMVGLLDGDCIKTDRLVHFGYISISAKEDQLILPAGGAVKGHEFHYWSCSDNGSGCIASRVSRDEKYDCAVSGPDIYAGYPHLYFFSNTEVPARFVRRCLDYRLRGPSS